MWKWKKTTELDTKSVLKSWHYAVLALAVGSMAFFGVCDPQQGGQGWMPSGAPASVDGVDVTNIEFRRAHINMSNQMQQQYKDQFDPVAMRISEQVLDGLVNSLVIYLEASKNGLHAAQSEIDQIILDVDFFKGQDGKFDPELFQRYLRSQGHTEKSLTEELRRNIVSNKFRSLVMGSYRSSKKSAELDYQLEQTKLNVEFVKIDPNSIPVKVLPADVEAFFKDGGEAKVKEYYERNKAEFNQEAKVKARHILIAFKDARAASGEAAQRSKDDAKTLAEKVLAETKGADFAKLAEKYTDEPSGKTKGGDLGYFRKDQMVKEFAEAAFALKPGELSKVVESPFGFHIIKVEALQEPKSVTAEEAKQEIAEKLVAKERKPQIMAEKVKNLLAAVKEGKGDESLKELGLSWKESGEFALGARLIPGGLGADKNLRAAVVALKKPGELAPQALNVNGSEYILRLKSRTEADLSKLDPKQLDQVSQGTRMMEAYGLYNELTTAIRKDYETKKKISKNPEYLNYDLRMKGGES